MAHKSKLLTAIAAVAASGVVDAAIIEIKAVELGFVPENVNASAGDVLEFHFQPYNHSVAMGDFDNPCMPAKQGGFFSGYLPALAGENATVFRVTVNDTSPMVYYCTQPIYSHCKNGMFGFVNSADVQAQQAYKSGAAAVNTSGAPGAAFGGVLVANPNASAVVTASSGSSASTSAMTSAPGPSGTTSVTPSASAKSDATGLIGGGAAMALVGSGLAAWLMAMMIA